MIPAPVPAPFPPRLLAVGVPEDDPTFRAVLPAADLPIGSMRRVSVGDLDILLANTDRGVFAVDDRCPHMAAPLSIGELDGCIVACPLHEGRFDLASGDAGADADDRRPGSRRRLPPDLVGGRTRAQGGPARQEGRGPPADPHPPLPLLPGASPRRPDRDRAAGRRRRPAVSPTSTSMAVSITRKTYWREARRGGRARAQRARRGEARGRGAVQHPRPERALEAALWPMSASIPLPAYGLGAPPGIRSRLARDPRTGQRDPRSGERAGSAVRPALPPDRPLPAESDVATGAPAHTRALAMRAPRNAGRPARRGQAGAAG